MTSRRDVLRLGAMGAAVSVMGCAREAAPGRQEGAVTGVGEALAPSVPAASEQTARAAAPSAGWDEEWGRALEAARGEGRLSLLTLVGRGHQAVIERFEQLSGVTVDHVAESSSGVWLSALRRARAAGQGFDVALVQPVPALTEAARGGMWAPLKPLLFRPDVLDDSVWRGGVEGRFLDAKGEVCFDWEYHVHHAYAINTDLVKEGEI